MFRAELTRTAKAVAAALAACAVVAPTAVAGQDLRSPDTRDSAAIVRQDLRSPDTRDVSTPASPVVEQRFTDLRSPDARDAGRDLPFVVHSTSVESGGFDWADAAVGAGILAAVLSLVLVGVSVRRRHHGGPIPV